MTNRWKFLIAIAFASFGCLTVHAETPTEIRAASVLFRQFETVAYTRMSFISGYTTHDSETPDSEGVMRFPFIGVIGGFQGLEPNIRIDLGKSYGSVLVGAKEFVGPHGFGMVDSRKCFIGVLEGGAQPNLESDFSKAARDSIDGRQVWTWSIPISEGETVPPRFYAAQVAGSYFVMTNSREDFQEVAKALTSAESSMPAPIDVFGWEIFSTYKYWAYRKFRRSGVMSEASGIEGITPDVVAFTVFADVDKREGFIRILSSDKSMKTIPKVFLPESMQSLLQPQGAGIWQAAIPLSKDEAGFEFMIQIYTAFGFGVVV